MLTKCKVHNSQLIIPMVNDNVNTSHKSTQAVYIKHNLIYKLNKIMFDTIIVTVNKYLNNIIDKYLRNDLSSSIYL
ncbi:hypothetical protein HBA_0947 [Sodalis endosymbiont of Henestaris halophilus]|nr:hypothetical protein HBA_0947 [Sodalis endosymbiont of Henestaris halophilus]